MNTLSRFFTGSHFASTALTSAMLYGGIVPPVLAAIYRIEAIDRSPSGVDAAERDKGST